MAENPARPVIRSLIAENIGIATISKPPVNPLSSDVCTGLLEFFNQFEKAKVRVVIIRADPNTKIWSAGHDVHEIPLDGQDAVHWTTGFVQVLQRVRNCPMPVIAMLHSSVWRGLRPGRHLRPCHRHTQNDVRHHASQDRSLLQHRGHIPLPQRLPLHVVKEMVFTGDPLSAEDAYRFGLLNRLVEPEKIEETTMRIARTIASRAPLAVAVVKAELRSLTASIPMSAHEFESIQSLRRAVFRSDDLKEGVKAFFDKRPPVFQGN